MKRVIRGSDGQEDRDSEQVLRFSREACVGDLGAKRQRCRGGAEVVNR